MKKMFLRTVHLLLVTLVYLDVAAQSDVESNGVCYNIIYWSDQPYAEVVSFSYDEEENKQFYTGDVVIAPSVTYRNMEIPVTSIENSAFKGCSDMTSLYIPYSISDFPEYSYMPTTLKVTVDPLNTTYDSRENCNAIIHTATNKLVKGFTNTVIPSNIEIIGKNAFYNNTELSKINIPNSVKEIEQEAFCGCSGLTDVSFSNNMKTIGRMAFGECASLTAVEIPFSVKSIYSNAFYNCTNLTSVTLSSDLDYLDHSAFLNTPWFAAWNEMQPDGMVYWGKLAWYYKGIMPESASIVIKDGTTGLMPALFYGKKTLQKITIPASVKLIGQQTFQNCSGLQEIYIGDLSAWCNITFEDQYSNPFCSCYNSAKLFVSGTEVQDLVIPEGVTAILKYAFAYFPIDHIQIPSTVTCIGDNSFYFCRKLKSLIIPGNVKAIGYNAFRNCSNIETLEFEDGLESIGACAFQGLYKITTVKIPESVISIGDSGFAECEKLTSMDIPYGITIIPGYMLYGAGLTSFSIPGSVKEIGEHAFRGCRKMTKLVIPGSVQLIGNEAFASCPFVDVYNFSEELPTIGYDIFRKTDLSDATLHVPASALDAYKAASSWKNFGRIVPLTAEDYSLGIQALTTHNSTMRIYDANGRLLPQMKRGLNIVHSNDGMIRKVIVR